MNVPMGKEDVQAAAIRFVMTMMEMVVPNGVSLQTAA
jgi:hypothetical protein